MKGLCPSALSAGSKLEYPGCIETYMTVCIFESFNVVGRVLTCQKIQAVTTNELTERPCSAFSFFRLVVSFR